MLRLLPITLWQPAALLPQLTRAISGYQLYVKENYDEVKQRVNSKKMEDISKELGASWKALSQADKDDYKRKGADIPNKHTPKAAPAKQRVPRSPSGMNLYVKQRFASELPSITETGVAKRDRVQGFLGKFASEWKQMDETEKARYNEMAKKLREE